MFSAEEEALEIGFLDEYFAGLSTCVQSRFLETCSLIEHLKSYNLPFESKGNSSLLAPESPLAYLGRTP